MVEATSTAPQPTCDQTCFDMNHASTRGPATERNCERLRSLSPSKRDNDRDNRTTHPRRSSTDSSRRQVAFNHNEEVVIIDTEYSRKKRNSIVTPWTRKMVLTLDGGGIRGLSSLFILLELMKEIESVEHRLDSESRSSADSPHLRNTSRSPSPEPKYLPCHYFDYIGGTGTGGLIAIMLGRLRMSVDECMREFANLDGFLFGRNDAAGPLPRGLLPRLSRTWPPMRYRRNKALRYFPSDRFETSEATRKGRASKGSKPESQDDQRSSGKKTKAERRSSLGQNASKFISDPSRCKTIVLCVQIYKGTSKPYVFRSYDHRELSNLISGTESPPRSHSEDDLRTKVPLNSLQVTVSQVAQAITATPTIFKAFELKSMGYVDGSIYANNPTLEMVREVTDLHQNRDDAIDTLVSIGTKQQNMSRHFSILSHNRALLKALNRSTDVVDDKKVQALQDGVNYFRFDAQAEYDDKVRGKKILKQLEKNVSALLKDEEWRKRLAKLAQALVTKRKARADTPAWESFALNVTYKCKKNSDPSCKASFSRMELFQHWLVVHGYDYPDASEAAKVEEELDLSRNDNVVA